MVSIRYFCGVGEFTWLKSRPRGCFTSNTDDDTGNATPIAANVSRKSRRVIPRFMRSCVGSDGAIARLAEVTRGRIAAAKLVDAASIVMVMASSIAVRSNEMNPYGRNQDHKRFAEDVFWKLAERKVDAGGRHPPSPHSRARTGTSERTESDVDC